MTVRRYDVLVVGGGISGVSIGYELSRTRTVGLIDMEPVLAYHTSGRSVATLLESYGGPVIRALTTASRALFENPPDSMDGELLSELGLLWLGAEGVGGQVRALYESVRALAPGVRLVSGAEAEALNPALRPGFVELALFEPDAAEIDVHALHQGYVRGLQHNGGTIHLSAGLVTARRTGGLWHVGDSAGEQYEAGVLVNAAGSWVDQVAGIAGARPIGIRPLRRTAFLITPPDGLSVRGLPLVHDVGRGWYFLPSGDMVICSPGDETPVEPCDAKPDEVQIARALEEINAATIFGARSIRSPWAGLRNFAPDGDPVVGWDPQAEGFFWYAGQGGYGMQIAPALSKTGAALMDGRGIDPELAARGLDEEDLSPSRAGMPVPGDG